MRLFILTLRLFVVSSLLLALAACSSSSQTPSDGGSRDVTMLCVPGASVACVGPGGCSGGQVCSADGTSFGTCDCSHPSPEAGSDGAPPADASTDATDATDATADVGTVDATSTDAPGTDAPSTDATSEAETSAGDSGPGACNGRPTTISGKVYDPATKNPVYDVDVYVPGGLLPVLPKGVPTGAGACSCSALYPSGMLAKTKTGVDGTFTLTLTDVPAGGMVTLVLQIGKWRRVTNVNVTACHDNPQPDRSLTLPATVAPGSDDNIPDIAVSTGSADTLECLLLRVGLPTTEYVAGAATTGHVHVFSGGDPTGMRGAGTPETNPMPGAPESDTSLWDSPAHLMAYDITLLSCEAGETYNASPANLETYLNAGGRVFASHFHYAWFSGALSSGQTYPPPSDWGSNLATWSSGSSTSTANPIGGIPVTTLNGSVTLFPKGLAMQQWLANVQALGQGVPAGEVPIYAPRFNAVVGPTNKPSQPWLTSDSSGVAGQTMSFSFNTPVNPNPAPTGVTYCGRAVYSDLHAAGDPAISDITPPPGGCANADLSPAEKVLEFMLFDLSGCVLPDSSSP
jgi:hypothetical protein